MDKSTANTENHQDKSPATYNYYTYNTPSTNPGGNGTQGSSSVGTAPNTSASASASVSVTPAGETEASGVSDGSASDTMDNISETSTNVQISDNIKLDLGNVDIVYEMNGGILNIENSFINRA